jgi:HEPN domain-containing protein
MTSVAPEALRREYAHRWLVKAEGDLAMACRERATAPAEMVVEGVCFHCQQSAEKDLKAFLVATGVDFKKVHDLEYLRELCSRSDAAFAALELGNLTNYAVSARYPEETEVPSIAQADEAIALAQATKLLVRSKLGLG